LAPTWYITEVVTTGAVLSWCSITCRPFDKSYSSKETDWALAKPITNSTIKDNRCFMIEKMLAYKGS
jgi:hypothetical protein